jgi:glucosylceramidase
MKYNKHYAGAMSGPGMPPNGVKPGQVGKEGTDMFIQEDRCFSAYAAYIVRFIEAYRSQGINIGMVMPQNEFNSAQVFPSCCWTPEGLATFTSFLGPEMEKLNVDVFFGTPWSVQTKSLSTFLFSTRGAPNTSRGPDFNGPASGQSPGYTGATPA